MILETEGIVLKTVKAAGGRKLLVILTEKYGKITVGMTERKNSRKRSALAQRPFVYGRYEIFENRGYYNYNSGDVIKSRYKIGEDIEKYAAASFVMELTEKVIPEGIPVPDIFRLLNSFMNIIEVRKGEFDTPVIVYELKLLANLGLAPVTEHCAICGNERPDAFSVEDGGFICKSCFGERQEKSLIQNAGFAIVSTVDYILKSPFDVFSKIALKPEEANKLKKLLRQYIDFYLDTGPLKSEKIFGL